MNERRQKLLETMKQFNKGQKGEILSFGNEAQDKEVIPTGIKTVDKFIGGGTKRGTFTVIYGGEKVGKSTLVLQAISNAQKDNKLCCYIDLEHTFDKKRAISLGINLEELVLAEKCENAEQALEIIRTLCKQKVIDLIVVDSIQAMSPKNEQENKGKERELASKEIAELARTLSKFFRVVSPDVFNAQASVIMIGQIRIAGIGSFYTHADLSGGEALKHWAFTRCFVRRGQKSDSPITKIKEYFIDPESKIRYITKKEELGFDVVIKLEKTKSSKSVKEGSEVHIPFLFDKGFVDEVEQNEDIPIRIDSDATEEQRKKIEDYLKEKKVDEARQLGIYVGTEQPKIKMPEESIKKEIKSEDYSEVENKISEEALTPKKKKRGRPRKK